MKSSIKLISIKDITVYLHFTFLLFVVWLVVLYIISGMQSTQLFWSVLFLLALFTCIVVHEYGHALVAARFGINAKKITLYPIGGIASIEKLPENPKQELWISIAGPVVSFCLAGLFFLFAPQPFTMQTFRTFKGVLDANNFLFTLGVANLLLAIFNLIPAFPMDGGRILRALLAFRFNYIKATAIAASIGRVIAIFIIISGLLSLNLLLAVIGGFILLFAQAEESYLQIKTLVSGIKLKEVLMYDFDSIDAQFDINEAANIIQNKHSKYFIVTDHGVPIGTLNRIAVMKAVAEQDYDKKVGDLINEDIEHLEGDMLVQDMLDKFSGNEDKPYPVFEHERFLGVVSFQHIIEYLLIHNAASKDYTKTKSLAGLV